MLFIVPVKRKARMVVQGHFIEPAVCLKAYSLQVMQLPQYFIEPAVCLSGIYDVLLSNKIEIQGKITGPCNIGHSDLQIV